MEGAVPGIALSELNSTSCNLCWTPLLMTLLIRTTTKFQGRQVYESPNGLATDSCFDSVPALQITKSYASSPDSRIGLECRMGRGSANDYGSTILGFRQP